MHIVADLYAYFERQTAFGQLAEVEQNEQEEEEDLAVHPSRLIVMKGSWGKGDRPDNGMIVRQNKQE